MSSVASSNINPSASDEEQRTPAPRCGVSATHSRRQGNTRSKSQVGPIRRLPGIARAAANSGPLRSFTPATGLPGTQRQLGTADSREGTGPRVASASRNSTSTSRPYPGEGLAGWWPPIGIDMVHVDEDVNEQFISELGTIFELSCPHAELGAIFAHVPSPRQYAVTVYSLLAVRQAIDALRNEVIRDPRLAPTNEAALAPPASHYHCLTVFNPAPGVWGSSGVYGFAVLVLALNGKDASGAAQLQRRPTRAGRRRVAVVTWGQLCGTPLASLGCLSNASPGWVFGTPRGRIFLADEHNTRTASGLSWVCSAGQWPWDGKQNYIKSKLMLALIGNVSEGMVNRSLGEGKPTRQPSGWNWYVAFSTESATTPVPPKGSPNGCDKRNGHLGAAWASLLPDEKAVFSPPIFQCLSKIPYTIANKEDDENEEIQLSDAEMELYEPLYQNLVNHKKVQSILSKGPESTTTQSSIFKQEEQSLTKLNLGLYTMSSLYNTTYYLMVSTRETAKENFEAYSQAQEIQELVDKANGLSKNHAKPSDLLKSKLLVALNVTLDQLAEQNYAKHCQDEQDTVQAKKVAERVLKAKENRERLAKLSGRGLGELAPDQEDVDDLKKWVKQQKKKSSKKNNPILAAKKKEAELNEDEVEYGS
ncbi:hypothetical protein PCANC_27631 [Puccinia coronata f. sp. avenae]|uniref:Uncharacterized protein n=1 Tax=Puccinia coronata f. sp. avenae TaxID=200324 RepID=A0A2N5TJA9_9BASI|nr:hypothetical protein PCANC_27631 [Puccinia coronata f. sp. avenae]